MTYQIVEKFQEPSGRWCVRVVLSPDESAFMWFEVEPDQAAIDAAADNQLRQRALAAPVVEVVTLKCSAWQIRKALNATGLRDAVEYAVSASNDRDLQDGWNHATEFLRYEPLVLKFGVALGKTDAELDALFELARTL